MTKDEALNLLEQYCDYVRDVWHQDAYERKVFESAAGMYERFPLDGSEAKAMRWLGYMQGILVFSGVFTFEEIEQHLVRKYVFEDSMCRTEDCG